MFYHAKWPGPEARKRKREEGNCQRRRDPMDEWKEKTESKGTIDRETTKPNPMRTHAEERIKDREKKPQPSTDGRRTEKELEDENTHVRSPTALSTSPAASAHSALQFLTTTEWLAILKA